MMIKLRKGEKAMGNVFRRFTKAFQGFLVALAVVAMSPFMAHAEPPALTLPSSVDLSDLFPYAAAIVAALVGLIVIRKAIKLTNRS